MLRCRRAFNSSSERPRLQQCNCHRVEDGSAGSRVVPVGFSTSGPLHCLSGKRQRTRGKTRSQELSSSPKLSTETSASHSGSFAHRQISARDDQKRFLPCPPFRFTKDDSKILYLRETSHGSEMYHLFSIDLPLDDPQSCPEYVPVQSGKDLLGQFMTCLSCCARLL